MASSHCDKCGRSATVKSWGICCNECGIPMGTLVTDRLPRKSYCAACMKRWADGELKLDGVDVDELRF